MRAPAPSSAPPSAATIEPVQAEKVEPQGEPATVADESGEKDETESVVESAAAKKKIVNFLLLFKKKFRTQNMNKRWCFCARKMIQKLEQML